MRGCGCLLGGLLIPIAIIGLMLFVVLPAIIDIKTIAPLNNALQTILCEKGETLSTEQHVGPSDDGGTSYSASYYCDNGDSVERDVTGRATMIGIMAFVIPFMLGLFLIIGTSMGVARSGVSVSLAGIPSTVYTNTSAMNSFGVNTPKENATERLRSLKSAYDQGLITEAEYESKKQEILREM